PGAQVRFSCDPGFYLLGEPVVHCQNKGEWSHPLPSCEKVSCGPPQPLENGWFQGTDFHAGSSVEYQCNSGFYLLGDTKVHCANSGKWGGNSPACLEPVKCKNPGFPDFGHREGSNFLMGGEVVFGCGAGYEVVGTPRLHCLETGNWDNPLPYCRALSCLKPVVPENSVMSGSNFTYGSKVTFRCMKGFLPQIPYEFQCLASLRWSGTPPICHPVTCREPPVGVNAAYTFKTNTYQSKVTYTCLEGYSYTLIGPETRECLPSGRWSDTSAQCVPRSCGPPPAIDHAEPYESHQLFGDTANYFCTDGYIAGNNSKMMCNAQGQWAPPDGAEVPRCIANFCLRPPELPNAILDSVKKPKYPSNTEVSYKCEEGFMLNTTATLRCLMGGEWEPSPYHIGCVPVRCSRPESIERGYVSGTNYSFGAVVAYSCDKGFLIRGEKRRTCKANGEWGGVLPSCAPVTCSKAPLLKNGYILVSLNGRLTFNSTVTYACNAGYQLVGRRDRVCQANRQWSNTDPPACVLLTCSPPPDIAHGRFRGSDFQVGRKVQYVCDEGYELIGDANWTCLKNGKWDKSRHPHCSPVQCPEHPLKENHLVLKGLDSDSGTVELSCEDGYVLQGPRVLRCTSSQEWNDTFPVCKQVFCRTPPDVSFGGPSTPSPPFPFGSVVNYTCMEGFTLKKERSVSCLASGQWSSPAPECVLVECPQPAEVANGIVDVQGLMYLSKALYSCKAGYNLVGNSTVLCGEKGLWIGGVPSCRPIECSAPKKITNGKVTFTKLQFGQSALYSCLRGYRLQGPETLKCLASGEWDNEPPTCVQMSCTPPQPLENGFVEGQDHSFGVTVFYSCFPGFQLVGQDHLTCEEDGGWNGTAPSCVPAECQSPPNPDHGWVNVTDTSLGSMVKYTCEKGYVLEGEPVRQCISGRLWTHSAPTCRCFCGDPGAIANGTAHGGSFLYSSVVRFECSAGFTLEGSEMMTCQADGRWDGQKPLCEPVDCGPPTVPSDITFTGDEYGFSHEIQLKCAQPGFLIQGKSVSSCQADGTWSHKSPTCVPAYCDKPSSILNGRVLGSDFSFNSKVKYECDEGFALSGDPTRICQSDGLWDKPEPRCLITSCDPPEDISHGFLNGSSFNYGDVVEYVCFDGYEVLGDPILRCSAQGQWVGTVPRCQPCVCAPPTLNNAVQQGGNAAFSDTVIYRCRPGYRPKGYPHLACRRDGRWGEPMISCEPVSCGQPPAVAQAHVVGGNFTFPNQITYRCAEGYQLATQASTLSCQSDGTWSKHSIRCSPVPCPLPTNLSNPHVIVTGRERTPVGEAVTLSCAPGLYLQGSALAECRLGGIWAPSISSVSCEPVVCEKPPPLLQGVTEGESYNYGDFVMYSCLPGFTMKPVGSKTIFCLADGTWSLPTPACESKRCPPPPGWRDGGDVDGGGPGSQVDFRVGQSVRVTCPRGHEAKGSGTITCRPDQTWSLISSVCQRVSCGPPLHVANGVVRGAAFQFGDVAVYSCFGGYTMEGIGRSRCLENGTWTPPPPCRGRA
uniref:Sushi, von Willebrand factor type A, EGF and pentraxin domain containing 1 n=1 Tax=Tetraodon nigroviridis TaxID=99883 RepID=H3D8L5_TETNG